ncbi:MAG TPA: hypothetical protein VF120_10245 [Ktedonobacterales bacterium]
MKNRRGAKDARGEASDEEHVSSLHSHDLPTPQRLLADLRFGGNRARRARSLLAYRPSEPARDGDRADVTYLLVSSLQPGDHTLARWLLEQETMRQRALGAGGSDAFYALVAALARFGSAEDALAIWRAHEATPQTQAGVDVEQLGRLGEDAVRRYLSELAEADGPDAPEARAALVWLDEGLNAGAFADLPGYFSWADERFGLHVSGPV